MSTKIRIPSFPEAKNRRQKVRAAGMNPNYWYPVGYAAELGPGEVTEVTFWGKDFALFRGQDGRLRAIENRCAHRQLKLTTGEVRGCQVVCPYHGWTFDGDGRLVDIPHELFDKKMPNIRLPDFEVRERYGLIWLFPGERERAASVPMPEIPELEGPDAWACVPVDFTWQAHHSMIIDNVSDFTHEYLHRKFEPFKNPTLTSLEVDDDKVFVEYDTEVGAGKLYNRFIPRAAANTSHMRLCYAYPHQWSNTDDWIKHWCFVLPIDERTTRAFFLFYYKQLKIPLLPVAIPRWLMVPILEVANRVLMQPLLEEDGFAVEAEQLGYERHYDAPVAELNPAVMEFQKLTIRKWEEYLAERDAQPRQRRLPVMPSAPHDG
ncbi:Toluene-4-sulfonate monooxygenase system iron-sulfur subunit TsaM1 [Enhygromyxa salina]|uniref:Toluene-4-sulfonate monooxygenase system iron-sulfur subunit TsaM1 n=1 Tax=Enhygromyxa salina TaxID=215803 RepID=A0A2S9XER2_9BACT|nr:aromatic ring-hydroxylating dioxygenase subunit alpha [Enhygromyxa salina]PRP91161.1 Toluene-4-sulfonate monooxygenase system iron-sulfur subunit TsaM1 [Enhygromyxa salina]